MMKKQVLVLALLLPFVCVAQNDHYSNRMEIFGNTLQLEIRYTYNNPDVMDEEHGSAYIIQFLQRKKIKTNKVYAFPSESMVGLKESWEAWSGSKSEVVKGTIKIILQEKDKVEAEVKLDDPLNEISKGTIVFLPKPTNMESK